MSETCRGHLWEKIIVKLFASSWYIFLTYIYMMHGHTYQKHVEAIYENKIIVKLFASSWYIFLTYIYDARSHLYHNPNKSGTPSLSPNNYAVKAVSLRLTHDAPHTAVTSEAISYSLPVSFLSFTRWVRSHSVIPSDIVGEAIWSLWGDLIQHTPRHDPHLPLVSRSLSASLRERKNMLPLPETPGVVTDCPSFAVVHFSFGCTKQRELFRDLFAHETLLASSKRRSGAHNYTLRHETRYSRKKLSPCFLSNSFIHIETHAEIAFIQLGYTYTGQFQVFTVHFFKVNHFLLAD